MVVETMTQEEHRQQAQVENIGRKERREVPETGRERAGCHAPARRQIRRAKKDPSEGDEMKGQEDPEPSRHTRRDPSVPELSSEMHHRDAEAVAEAPEDERPAGAVPEASQPHGEEEAAALLGESVPIAAQRNVKVIP